MLADTLSLCGSGESISSAPLFLMTQLFLFYFLCVCVNEVWEAG